MSDIAAIIQHLTSPRDICMIYRLTSRAHCSGRLGNGQYAELGATAHCSWCGWLCCWVLCGGSLRTPPGSEDSNGKELLLGVTGAPGNTVNDTSNRSEMSDHLYAKRSDFDQP